MEPGQVAELIARCIRGDAAAKAQFYDEYAGLIRKAIAGKLHRLQVDPSLFAEVEDIWHEVIVRIFDDDCRALSRIKQPASINAWLVTVAQNHVLTYLRKRASRHKAQDAASVAPHAGAVATPEDAAARSEQTALIETKLATLSPQERLVLELYFVQNLKYAEISDVCGLNINTVSAKLRRAKSKLRKLLEEERDELPLR